MVSETLLTIVTKSLAILAWPPFSLICPLYASIRAMESDSHSSNQRCLAFWVLFSLSMIMEWELAALLNWFSWWPHVKGMATIILLIPYFGGAPYIYKYLIRLYCDWNPSMTMRTLCIFDQKSSRFVLDEDSKLVDTSDQTIVTSQIQDKKLTVHQVGYGPYNPVSCDSTKSNNTRPTGEKQVQKEWSCALCQISTSSRNCLRSHLHGKKHKAMENELKVELRLLSSTHKRINGMSLLRNLNQIANILSPVSRSIRWCEWTKPEPGWTKLNTDGSIQKGTASFGGLLRDYRGEPICAFVSKAPQGDVFLAELWAIWRGLVLSLGLGIKAIWVESDSMSVVKTINKEQPSCSKAFSCLKQIRKLLRQFDKYHVSHSWRETNRAADHLAKMVLSGDDVVLWPVDFPDSLCNIIKDDADGMKYLRR